MSDNIENQMQVEQIMHACKMMLDSAPAWRWFQFLSEVQSKVNSVANETGNEFDRMIAESVTSRAEILSFFFEALAMLEKVEAEKPKTLATT